MSTAVDRKGEVISFPLGLKKQNKHLAIETGATHGNKNIRG